MSAKRLRLRFNGDGTFTILQLTDIHWRNGDDQDRRSRALIELALDSEAPDLVVLTGDILSGEESLDPGAAYRAAVAPIEDRAVPWAAVFGNHDDEGALSRAALLEVQKALPHCLTERGPKSLTGVGNYVLRVLSARDDRMAAALYFIDSGAYNDLGIGHYAWIARDQIAWYARTSARLRHQHAAAGGATTLPALAFFHIPLPEYDEVWRTAVCRGHRHEPVCGPSANSGFFAALLEAGDVMGAFCGHDHVNDFEGELHGIRLCYGRATGFSPYGREGFHRGARVVRLRQGERTFETWVRLEDGSALTNPPIHEP
ncbi:MAG: metallophosphoesterase family protein [Vicinamibacteria bacterium]